MLARDRGPAGRERRRWREAIGRVLAEDVAAVRDQPPFAASAMDGWAVRAADAPGRLKIVGESAAGHGYDGAGRRRARRCASSPARPCREGCDAIVIQEDAAARRRARARRRRSTRGAIVRPAGGDFQAGAALLEPRRAARSLAAVAGGRRRAAPSCRSHAGPRVALLSTGEEIVEAPADARARSRSTIPASPALAAMIAGWGGAAIARRAGARRAGGGRSRPCAAPTPTWW